MSYLYSESDSEVTQLCLTLCDPMDSSQPGFSIHGIFQTRILDKRLFITKDKKNKPCCKPQLLYKNWLNFNHKFKHKIIKHFKENMRKSSGQGMGEHVLRNDV